MLLRVLDLETSGFEPPVAGVVELGWCDLLAVDDAWCVGRPEDVMVHPGHPIPPETSAIHHITDEDVARARPFAGTWHLVIGTDAFTPSRRPIAAYVAHNAAFERKFISDEMTGGAPWICTYRCALRAWPDAPGHSNGTLRYWLKPAGLQRDLAALAHRAGSDAYVTAFLARELLALHPIETLIAWSAEPALQVRCHIGRERGKRWSEVDTGFLYWVENRDFSEDILFTVRHELARRRAEERAAAERREPF